MRTAIIAALIAVTGTLCMAETTPLAEPGYELAYGESAEFAFTPTGQYGSVRLVYDVRMQFPRAAGSTYVMAWEVNGKPLNAAATRTSVRLLNKPLQFTMASGLEIGWAQGNTWRAVYSPDFELVQGTGAGGMQVEQVDPYRFVIDITDMVTRGEENTITLLHRGRVMDLKRAFPDMDPTLELVFRELAFDLSDEPTAITGLVDDADEFSADRVMLQRPATCDIGGVASVAGSGGLSIRLPDLDLRVSSRFSWEGGGFNGFAADERGAQPEWVVRKDTGDEDGATIVGTARDYRVERTVRFVDDHVAIEDRLVNTTDRDIGLAFDNRLEPVGSEVLQAYLCGNPDPAMVSLRGFENPTVFVRGNEAGCGLVALDDVYRIQAEMYWEDGAGIRSDVFCLPAGGEYTVEWAIYPITRPDYFDFINIVREDLDVNFTIPGQFQFGLPSAADMTPEAIRTMIEERDLAVFSTGTWANTGGDPPYYHGAQSLEAEHLHERFRRACENLRAVAPEVASLIYIHTFINLHEDTPERFPDSLITNADGTPYINPGYTSRIGMPFYYCYPALDNSYFDAMKRLVDLCLDDDEIGADGIYWDEVEMISPKRSYDRWDGYSAELDDEHRIARKFGDPHLLSLDAKVALVEHIRSKGGTLIGNSCPRTRTMQDMHFPRFVETAREWYPARAHLYSPISLGDHKTVSDFDTLLDDIRLKLMWGTVYYYYSRPAHPYPTITRHMFPFTPVELHRGWVLGEERLLTAVPGTFSLGDDDPVTVCWYDADGALADHVGEERVEGGKRLVRLDLAEGEMAVIERR
ncbi:MAG: hypothetical protein GF393_11520 [Armatimonadia bacterium]|nr:hypothetical protein [Armatimonadia bacterium]